MTRMVVVGNGSAGASACFGARKFSREVEIICVSEEPYPTYSRCALPFVIGGDIDTFDTPTVFDFEFFRKSNIDMRAGVTVESVDLEGRNLKTSDGDLEFDTMVIATGGRVRLPDVQGVDKDGVHVLHTRDQGKAILESAKGGATALVNGASFIALEVAEALKHRGMDVRLVIRSRALRSMIDAPFSKIIEEKAADKGIEVLKGSPVESVIGGGKVAGAIVGGEEIEADMVVMCTGIGPETSLAKNLGLELGPTGGIRTDGRLQTSAEGVYAAGDCAESTCFIRKTPVITGLGTIATRQGMVAGANAAGADLKAPPVLGASVMKFFDIEIGAVGLTEDVAKESGLVPVISTVKYPSLPHYYPGGRDIHVRLLADAKDGRIIGGQILAHRGVAERVNMLSMAILKGATAEELYSADFCYSPPCADVWAAEAIAAQGLVRRLERKRL